MNCDIDKLNKIAKPMSSKSLEQRKEIMNIYTIYYIK